MLVPWNVHFMQSVLMYAAPAIHLSAKQTTELNVCWNMVFRRIFSYNKWESVRAVINGCGRLDVKHLILLRKVKFYRRIFLDNSYVLHKLFCALLSTGSVHNSCMMSVFTVDAVEKICQFQIKNELTAVFICTFSVRLSVGFWWFYCILSLGYMYCIVSAICE